MIAFYFPDADQVEGDGFDDDGNDVNESSDDLPRDLPQASNVCGKKMFCSYNIKSDHFS